MSPRRGTAGPAPFEDIPTPGSWRSRGACAAAATEVFFPGRGISLEPAKAICRTCPVLGACRDYAVPLAELKGVWGGLGEIERRRLRARRVPAPSRRGPQPAGPGDEALYGVLVALTAHPGRWAQVAWYPSGDEAAATAWALRAGTLDSPRGGWLFEARGAAGGSALYACYQPIADSGSGDSGSEIAS